MRVDQESVGLATHRGKTALRNYIRKLLLTVDEFMALLEEC